MRTTGSDIPLPTDGAYDVAGPSSVTFYALDEPGLRTWKKNIGVKMPVSPPRTNATAAEFRKSDTAVDPLGATRVRSSTETSLLVSQRPAGVCLNPVSDQRPDSASHHGVSGS